MEFITFVLLNVYFVLVLSTSSAKIVANIAPFLKIKLGLREVCPVSQRKLPNLVTSRKILKVLKYWGVTVTLLTFIVMSEQFCQS